MGIISENHRTFASVCVINFFFKYCYYLELRNYHPLHYQSHQCLLQYLHLIQHSQSLHLKQGKHCWIGNSDLLQSHNYHSQLLPHWQPQTFHHIVPVFLEFHLFQKSQDSCSGEMKDTKTHNKHCIVSSA